MTDDYDHIGDPEDYQERTEQAWAQEVADDREALDQLRAAIEALVGEYGEMIERRNDPACDEKDRWTQVCLIELRKQLRALLADNGAAALREVKAEAWDSRTRDPLQVTCQYCREAMGFEQRRLPKQRRSSE